MSDSSEIDAKSSVLDPEEPPFHRAARLGDIPEMERLRSGIDINAQVDLPHYNLYDVTALMVAAQSVEGADVNTLIWLQEQGADLHIKSSMGGTAAWYCAGGGARGQFHPGDQIPDHAQRLRFLLNAGLDLNCRATNGQSLLTQACQSGDPARVRLLLERGVSPHPFEEIAQEASDVSSPLEETSTTASETFSPAPSKFYSFQIPLFCAVASGSAECVQLLLDAGADLHLLDLRGSPALANAGSPEVVRALIAAGADPNEQYREEDVLGRVFWGTELNDLSASERLDVAQALLDAGASRDSTAFGDWTPVYRAASRHQAEAVEFLLAQGSSCRSTDSGTPLHGICWQGEYTDPEPNIACERIIRMLVATGVPLDARDAKGDTALHNAAGGDWSNKTAVRLLLEFGAQPDLINESGHTPLHLAANQGCLSCVTHLLAAEADPLLPDLDGDTAVDIAGQNHHHWIDIIARGGLHLPSYVEAKDDYEIKKLQEAEDCIAALVAATSS